MEINSETDFAANDSNFTDFANSIADVLLQNEISDINSLNDLKLSDDVSVEEARTNLISKIGENISIRRFDKIHQAINIGEYSHGSRIGVIVSLDKSEPDLAKDIAMHIAASNPVCLDEEDVPEDLVSREKRIFLEQASSSGKPPEIIEKMVEGRMKKFFKEITLLGQSFIKDPDISIRDLLDQSEAKVQSFIRYEVGEGIEKKEENFADEVMKQIKGDS